MALSSLVLVRWPTERSSDTCIRTNQPATAGFSAGARVCACTRTRFSVVGRCRWSSATHVERQTVSHSNTPPAGRPPPSPQPPGRTHHLATPPIEKSTGRLAASLWRFRKLESRTARDQIDTKSRLDQFEKAYLRTGFMSPASCVGPRARQRLSRLRRVYQPHSDGN
jgi:hypothetical protein